MTAAEAARLRVLEIDGLFDLVATRIFTFRLPETVKRPAVLIRTISETQQIHLRGQGGLTANRIQVDCLADSIREARAVDELVLGTFADGAPTGLRGFTGAVGSPPVVILGCESLNAIELYEGDELEQPRVSRDYMLRYRPAA